MQISCTPRVLQISSKSDQEKVIKKIKVVKRRKKLLARIELTSSESKSDVLPLHHRSIASGRPWVEC